MIRGGKWPLFGGTPDFPGMELHQLRAKPKVINGIRDEDPNHGFPAKIAYHETQIPFHRVATMTTGGAAK